VKRVPGELQAAMDSRLDRGQCGGVRMKHQDGGLGFISQVFQLDQKVVLPAFFNRSEEGEDLIERIDDNQARLLGLDGLTQPAEHRVFGIVGRLITFTTVLDVELLAIGIELVGDEIAGQEIGA